MAPGVSSVTTPVAAGLARSLGGGGESTPMLSSANAALTSARSLAVIEPASPAEAAQIAASVSLGTRLSRSASSHNVGRFPRRALNTLSTTSGFKRPDTSVGSRLTTFPSSLEESSVQKTTRYPVTRRFTEIPSASSPAAYRVSAFCRLRVTDAASTSPTTPPVSTRTKVTRLIPLGPFMYPVVEPPRSLDFFGTINASFSTGDSDSPSITRNAPKSAFRETFFWITFRNSSAKALASSVRETQAGSGSFTVSLPETRRVGSCRVVSGGALFFGSAHAEVKQSRGRHTNPSATKRSSLSRSKPATPLMLIPTNGYHRHVWLLTLALRDHYQCQTLVNGRFHTPNLP